MQAELLVVSKSKTMLEKELQEVITLTSTELEEYQEKVMELEDEVNNEQRFVSLYILLFMSNRKLFVGIINIMFF